MRLQQWLVCLSTGFLITSTPLAAKTLASIEQIQLPQCLAAKLTPAYPVLAENKDFKIIDIPAAEVDKLALLADKVRCGRFVNLSHSLAKTGLRDKQKAAEQLLKTKNKAAAIVPAHYEIRHEDDVYEAIARVNSDNIIKTLTHLTDYYNRSALNEDGVETAKWLKAAFEEMAAENGREDTESYFVETGGYRQPSVVTVIGKELKAPGIVIGAHMDTLDGRMPGAGDDGSGSSSIMEIARVLLASKNPFNRPVYIIWYAAEERGLVGSQHVVEHFLEQSIPVKAAIQFDMTGFRNDQEDPSMWVFRDYTDKNLSNFVAELIKTYIKVPVKYSSCGYGCSDHASWMAEGIPAAFPCETSFEEHNPNIHSAADTMELLNTEHMTNFTKLGLAFAVELASE